MGAERIAWIGQPGHLPASLWRGVPRSRELTPELVQRYRGRLEHPRDTCHDGWELAVVLRGRGLLLADGERPLTPATAWLIPPGLPHRGRSDGTIDMLWIALAGTWLDALPRRLQRIDGAEALAGPARQLWLRAEQRATAVGAELDGLARCLVGRALHGVSEPDGAAASPIDLLIECIHAHRSGPLRLGRIATRAGCSVRHLNRLCRQRTGLPPLRYLRRVRIERARLLMAYGGRTLAEVAALSGFSDPAYFSRVFRRETGRPPSAFLP